MQVPRRRKQSSRSAASALEALFYPEEMKHRVRMGDILHRGFLTAVDL